MKQIFTFLASITFISSTSALPYLSGVTTNLIINQISDNTNFIVVYGVGDVASQGTYQFKDIVNGIARYSNLSGNGRFVSWDPNGFDFGLDGPFAITNGSGGELYISSGVSLNQPSLLPQVFNKGAIGTAPGGTITWGTNVTPTTFPQFISVPVDVALPTVQSNYWFVRTNGNDLTATRGRMDLPAKTLRRVFTNAVAGDVVFIGGGHFTNEIGRGDVLQYPQVQFPANFVVKGAGIGVTFIDGKPTSGIWNLGNSNVISDFTATNLWIYDAIIGTITNIEIHDIEDVAQGDVIVFQNGIGGMVSIWNCRLGGNSDKIADLTPPLSAVITNTFIDVNNITIFGGSGASDSAPDGLNPNGAMTWRGGGIHVQTTSVIGAAYEEHILTNGVFGLGQGGYIFAPQLVRTNWIGGQLYTNGTSGWMEVQGVSVLTVAAVSGGARNQLWCYNKNMLGGGFGTTNQHSLQTTASTSAGTNSVSLSLWIPPGYVFAFTNQSGGSGNSATVIDGQYFLP